MAKKLTREAFLKKAQAVHGNEYYNYSNVMNHLQIQPLNQNILNYS